MRVKEMTWEIIVGLLTLVSSFIAIMKVVVNVNRSLTSLEAAVRQLREYIARQSEKNEHFHAKIDSHELRIQRLEDNKQK